MSFGFVFDGVDLSNPVIIKTDDEALDYSIDYSRLLGSGETLIASAWTVADGLTKGAYGIDQTEKIATQWLSDGTAGETYQVDNLVITSEGRKFERSFRVRVTVRR